jgi:dTDP-4-amino-4,6-dideoxygalactose transaminase
MRGQVPDMDAVMAVVNRCGLTVVEDCAHTLGAKWKLDGENTFRHIGTFGAVGTWSMQTNKSLNCGEGGLISTSRQDIAAFVTVATGSYGHYEMNGASGDPDKLREIYATVPNMSMRLTTLAAAIAKPQLADLPYKLERWARHAFIIRRILKQCPHVRTMKQQHALKAKLVNVWSSIQFEVAGFTDAMVEDVIQRLSNVGIPLAWFGGPCKGFTSTLRDWKFADPDGKQWKDKTANSIKYILDLPLYHTTGWSDIVIQRVADLIVESINTVAENAGASAVGEACLC